MASILVAYATKYGSTREVAEAVAEQLRARGHAADLKPAGQVTSLEGYDAAVLGSAFYYFRMLKDGRRFLKRNRAALESMPVAVFGLGPFENKPEDFQSVREQLDKALAKHEWLKPTATAVFGGAFDPAKLQFPMNNPAMRKIPPADIRDWDAIRVWADELPEAMGIAE